MTDPRKDEMNILVPVEAKPRLDYLHREVEAAAGFRLNRREALGLGGMALLGVVAAACGASTTSGDNPAPSGSAAAGALAGKPLESKLQIYNWSQYDAKSTYSGFENLPAEKAAGLTIHETYYSSNDELLAKLEQTFGDRVAVLR